MHEWELKLNVNVLLGLCTHWNAYQAAWVEAEYWCSAHVPRLWTANLRRENTYAHALFKTLHCAASILRQQTVQHKGIITVTQKSESRKPDSSTREKGGQWVEGQGRGPFPFKAKQTIMKLRYFLQEWRTHYPPFQQQSPTKALFLICDKNCSEQLFWDIFESPFFKLNYIVVSRFQRYMSSVRKQWALSQEPQKW